MLSAEAVETEEPVESLNWMTMCARPIGSSLERIPLAKMSMAMVSQQREWPQSARLTVKVSGRGDSRL